MEAGAQVKQHGLENDLVDRIKASEYFAPIKEKMEDILNPAAFVGRAPQQVSFFIRSIHIWTFYFIGRRIFEERSFPSLGAVQMSP